MGMRGPVTKSSGEFAAMPVKGNYLIGLTANEYFVNATGARKGNADTAMKTAAAGYLTRRLVDVAQDVIIRDQDCQTSKGLYIDLELMKTEDGKSRKSKKYESLTDEYEGDWEIDDVDLIVLHRILANDVKVGKELVAKVGDVVTDELLQYFKEKKVGWIKFRSVLTCDSDYGICATCYGTSLATKNPVELGEAVGIIAAQSIGEPGTQLTMRTFHTGGASDKTKKEVIKTRSGGKETRAERTINYDITQGLTGVTDLLEARIGMSQKDKVAVIAFWPGKVDIREVESKSGAKKFEVRVVPQGDKALADAKEYAKSYTFSRTASKTFKKLDPELPITIVDSLDQLLVLHGDEVERGDYIKDGTPIPQEVLATQSVNAAAIEIINGVQAIYKAQDVALHWKHLEVIVRQMLSKVTIVDSGETALMPGAQMDRRTFMRINREARDEGKKTASARDEVLGMTRASLAAESWLSAASFQETTRVLTQAALDRSTDKLKGLKENVIIGKLIPAGTGLAAYRQIDAVPTEEAKAERYPNIPWATTSDESIDYKDDSFSGAGLSFTSLEDYSNEEPAQ
jgi:DNA-directed RNA polymerase subunit beta'